LNLDANKRRAAEGEIHHGCDPGMQSACRSLWLMLAALVLFVGCQSSQPGGSSHAAVEIKDRTSKEIQATTVVVFAENGFSLRTNTPTLMRFERMASSGEKLKYGDWLNDGMAMLVKVRLQSLPDNAHLLSADVYRVQDPDDPNFREERRVTLVGTKFYRKLLEEIARRLGSPPPE